MNDNFEDLYYEIKNKINIGDISDEKKEKNIDKRVRIIMLIISLIVVIIIGIITKEILISIILGLSFIFIFSKANMKHIEKKSYSRIDDEYKATLGMMVAENNSEKVKIDRKNEEIIDKIINKIFPYNEYKYNCGLEKEEFNSMGFCNKEDKFFSNGLIQTKINGNMDLKVARVYTELVNSQTHDSYILDEYEPMFIGLVSILKNKDDSNQYIKIREKSLKSLKLNKKYMIDIEEEEFRKYYDIESNDEYFVHKILTTKLIYMLVYIKEKLDISLEINIINKNIYIRIHDNRVLKIISNEGIDKKQFLKSCEELKSIKEINEIISETIN